MQPLRYTCRTCGLSTRVEPGQSWKACVCVGDGADLEVEPGTPDPNAPPDPPEDPPEEPGEGPG